MCSVQQGVCMCWGHFGSSQAHNLTSLQLWTTWSNVQPGKILHVLLPVSEWPELCVWTNMRLKFTNRHVGNLIYLVLLLHSHSQFATLIALHDSYPTWKESWCLRSSNVDLYACMMGLNRVQFYQLYDEIQKLFRLDSPTNFAPAETLIHCN